MKRVSGPPLLSVTLRNWYDVLQFVLIRSVGGNLKSILWFCYEIYPNLLVSMWEQFVLQWGLKSCGMWLCVFDWLALDVLKDWCAFILRVKQLGHTLCPVKTKAFCTPETSVITHPTTQGHILEDASPQRHRCENLKPRLILQSVWLCVKQAAADVCVVTQ